MIREEQSKKNIELSGLFMQQVLDDPEILGAIPDDAEIVFLPQNDPELCEANLKLGKARQAEGRQVVYISIELVPQVRTFLCLVCGLLRFRHKRRRVGGLEIGSRFTLRPAITA